MADLYRLGQSSQGELKNVGEEIRLDVQLTSDPFLSTGSVTGVITDEEQPVEGVLIKILDNEHNPLYHILTDEDGGYAINGIPPGSEYHIAAVKDSYLLNEITSFVMVAGETLEIDGTLTKDPNAALSTIAIHMFDSDDNPVEGVVLNLAEVESGVETDVAITSTNEYGQGVFMDVALGNYIIRGTKQGYETIELELKVSEASSIVNVTESMTESKTESKGTINGIITDDDGNPVDNAVVILYEATGDDENPDLTPIKYTRTTSTGAYLFGEVDKGNYVVKSNKED